MGLSVSLVTFSPNTTIKSSDVNSNFQQILNANNYYGNLGTQTTNVYITLDDVFIIDEDNIRIKCGHGSDDRGICLSGRLNGVVQDGFKIYKDGHCRFIQINPEDRDGDSFISGQLFGGFGSGFYNHGCHVNTPQHLCITCQSTVTCSVSFSNLGNAQVKINLSINVSFTCHAHKQL